MSNKAFDRQLVQLLERPVSTDFNLVETYSQYQLVESLYRMFGSRNTFRDFGFKGQPGFNSLSAGFLGDAFTVVNAGAGGMQVTVGAGLGFFCGDATVPQLNLGGTSGVHELSQIKPMYLSAAMNLAAPAADPVNSRIDIVEVKLGRQAIDASNRDIFNPSAVPPQFQPNNPLKTLSYALDAQGTVNGAGAVNYKSGTPAASPSPPAVDAGYVKIAEITVPANATLASQFSYTDSRRLLFPSGILRCSGAILVNGNASPVLQNVIAPPGVDCFVVITKSGGNVTFYRVVILCGDASLFGTSWPNARISGRAQQDFVSGDCGIAIDANTPPGAYQIGAAGVVTNANLADATITAPTGGGNGVNQNLIQVGFAPQTPTNAAVYFSWAIEAQY